MKNLSESKWKVISRSYLFSGIEMDELKTMLPCLGAEEHFYMKDELIFRYGDNISKIGLVLSGSANIVRNDYWGNRHLVAPVLPSQIFGESYAAVSPMSLGVSVQAAAETDVLFLNLGRILHMCSSACAFHSRLIENLVALLASRNLLLNEKLTHITQHTLRDKLLSYLSAESLRQHSSYFDIPFDRQQLADYLNADRSALSNELSKMKKEGILDYEKNHFRLCASASNQLHESREL